MKRSNNMLRVLAICLIIKVIGIFVWIFGGGYYVFMAPFIIEILWFFILYIKFSIDERRFNKF